MANGCMYHQYFGLSEAPFSIAVNPRYLYMSPRHRDALAHLLYGVGAGGGFILLTGEVGTGKTTINRCLLEQLPDDTDIAIILNPALNAMELLATVCDELGIAYDHEKHTLKTLTDSLHRYVLENHKRGRKTVLLIDEAQHLDFEVLEQIRLLTNLETNSEKLLRIILIGQPELAQMLARPELRQLNQRITARYNLEPLSLEETGAYIRHRLQVAGLNPVRDIFPAGVVKGVHRYTRGIPRLINVLCDRMLLGAYGRNQGQTDMSMLRTAAHEVMGAEAAASRDDPRRFWLLSAVGLVLVAAVAAWWWQGMPLPGAERRATDGVQANAPAAVPDLHSAANTGANPAAAAATVNPGPDTAMPAPADSPTSFPAQETIPRIAPVVAGEPPAAEAHWMLSPVAARSRFWSLYSAAPPPPQLCTGELYDGLACMEGYALSWDELAEFDRPLLLDMVNPERFTAAVVFLGGNGRSAWVATETGTVELDLLELASAWTGGYRLLWQPPEGFTEPLGLGDEGPAVAQIAAMFARLDGQQQALTGNRYNAALQLRVRMFQRENGLEDDGVVGVQTLLKLNSQLGIDLTAAAARERLAAASGEVVTR